ncbi:MAG: RNA polymerase sigma factor [Prevotella sp.]|nr:RNA polymerase sigma factor [Prevotella sp.]
MSNLSDISLVTQVTVFHNLRAFDRLVVKYQSPIRRFFLNLTGGDGQTSDDLAQETFVKAYTHLEQFRATASFSTWLYRIAYNVFYDYRRKYSGRENREDAMQAEENRNLSASPTWENSSLRMDMQKAMGCLSDNERLCITLQLIEGQTIEEIGKIMQMPTGTVKSHLSRGKEKLAKYLKANGYQ